MASKTSPLDAVMLIKKRRTLFTEYFNGGIGKHLWYNIHKQSTPRYANILNPDYISEIDIDTRRAFVDCLSCTKKFCRFSVKGLSKNAFILKCLGLK